MGVGEKSDKVELWAEIQSPEVGTERTQQALEDDNLP